MSPVTNIWRQLVQRRLLPVAILMVAALAAVPFLLAKDPEPVPAPPVAAPVEGPSELTETPVVALASAEDRDKRRRVLGARKNPFALNAPAPENTGGGNGPATDGDTGSSVADTPAGTGDASTGGSAGGDVAPTPTAPSTPVAPTTPTEPAPPKKTYAKGDLTVRFGDAAGGGLARMTVRRGDPLPNVEAPVITYLGLLRDGKTAQFLIDESVIPVGDGDCHPSPNECETVRLKAGETQFFDIVEVSDDGTGQPVTTVSSSFQLDLVKIHKAGASASRAKQSSAGTRTLRAHGAVAGNTAGL